MRGITSILAFLIIVLLAMAMPNKEQDEISFWLNRQDEKEITEELKFNTLAECEEQRKFNADFDSKKGIIWTCQKRTEKIIK